MAQQGSSSLKGPGWKPQGVMKRTVLASSAIMTGCREMEESHRYVANGPTPSSIDAIPVKSSGKQEVLLAEGDSVK